MSAFMIVALVVIAVCVLAIAFAVGVLYGSSDYGNVFEWIKGEIKIAKEIYAEDKEEKKLLEANPLCAKCLNEGRYKKSEHIIKQEDGCKIPVCKEHYKEYFNERYKTL